MTVNALVNACNQKNCREPIVAYDDAIVLDALDRLKQKGLAASRSGLGRVVKYSHRACEDGLGLSTAQAAVMSILMLRGAQTPGELKTRAARQFIFVSLEAVQETLASLMTDERNYVEEAPRKSGQVETRHRHKFIPYVDVAEQPVAPAPPSLRSEMEELRQILQDIRDENAELRRSFEALHAELNELKAIIVD